MNKKHCEQIIIDGVFINACLVSEKCKEFETCKIKNILRQLARKTAECEELKEKIKQVKDFKDKVINQLKEENEELKEYKAVVDELAGKQIILTNKDKMPELYENAKDLKLNSYLKALEEIERICVYLQERPIYAESIIRTYLKSIKIQDVFEDKILDIISKAKGEENAR